MDSTEPSRKKRRLRAPAETVREKATKAREVLDAAPSKPKRRRVVGRVLSAPFRGLAWLGHKTPLRQIGHGIRWVFHTRIMRFLGRVLGLKFVRDSWKELRLVTWPNRKQSRQLTSAVIIFSILFGALVALVDFGLDKLFKEVILK